jgi:RND family efflux transporter MFP subunit
MNHRVYSALFLVAASGLAIALSGCGQANSETTRSQTQMPDPLVVYDTPIKEVVTDYEDFPGRTDALYSVDVRSRVSGYLKQVYFKDGQEVRDGDTLFLIDPRPFQATLDRAKATLEQAKAHAQRLGNEYRRAKALYDQGRSISREEFDRYAFDYAEGEAAVATAEANKDLAQLDVDFTRVTADLPQGVVGRLGRRLVDPGNLIKADDTPMTSIVSQDPIYVYFDVHELGMLKMQRMVRDGKVDPAKIPVDIALSDEKDYPHRGYVNFTDNRVDINTGTLRFRALLENPQGLITPGLFVKVRLTVGEPHPAIMIREQALVTDQGQKKVIVLRPAMDRETGGKPKVTELSDRAGKKKEVPLYNPQSVKVETGVLRGQYREILSGLSPGDMVVVSGMQKVRLGEKPNSKSEAWPKGEPYTVQARPFDPKVDAPEGAVEDEGPRRTAAPTLPADEGKKPAGAAAKAAPPGGARGPATGNTKTGGPAPSPAVGGPDRSPGRPDGRGGH